MSPRRIWAQFWRRSTAEAFCSVDIAGRPPEILVDVSVLYRQDVGTGIQRVVRSLVLALEVRAVEGHRVRPIYAARRRAYRYADPDFLRKGGGDRVEPGEPLRPQPGDIFVGLDLAAHILPRRRRQVRSWRRKGVSVQVVVYDLLPVLHPEWFNAKTTLNFRRWLHFLAQDADVALCISKDVMLHLDAWLCAHAPSALGRLKSVQIPMGADMPSVAPGVRRGDIAHPAVARPYVLMVGTIEPRKGQACALDAFEWIWAVANRATINLVIVGRPGWKTDDLQARLRTHVEAGARLFWLDNVDDAALQQLYAGCEGVLAASRGEGYGLPVIEALRAGKRVLARDLPVFREVGSFGATYFADDAPEALGPQILSWLAADGPDSDERIKLKDWSGAASDLIEIAKNNSRKDCFAE